MDSVKKVLDNLISNNIIVDKGKEGKESFFIVNVPSDSENIKNVENVEIVANVENVEDDTSLNAIGELIDDKFYSILINRIKSEVKLALDERLNCNIIKEVNTNKDSNTNDILITTLKEEIKFLRDELKSKDQVIELILQDKVNDHKFNLEGNSSGTRVHNNNATNISVNKKNDAADNTDFEIVKDKNKTRKKRSITILGDSCVKDIKSFEMKKCIKLGERIFVKTFPGATTKCMIDYAKPTMKHEPEFVILHTGTNDLESTNSPEEISDEIIKLGINMKTDSNDIAISGILPRNDQLNVKGQQVNDLLQIKCSRYALVFIKHSNIVKNKHLNNSGFHLNYTGTVALANNFLKIINV